MSKTVRIELAQPLAGHHGEISALVLRAPTWSDVMGVGSPYTIHRDKEDKPFLVYDEAAIAHYAEACLVEPRDPLLVQGLCLADTLKVREAVVDFFLAAAGAGGGSSTSSKNSSSNSDGSRTGSAD